MKIKLLIFYVFLSFLDVSAQCPPNTQQESILCQPIVEWRCLEYAPGTNNSMCMQWGEKCVGCSCSPAGSCTSVCCNSAGCYNRNGQQIGWSDGSGNWTFPSSMIEFNDSDAGHGGGGSCSSCPTSANLNCSTLDEIKCGQSCLGWTSCPIAGACPSCSNNIPIPDCNNTAPSDDVGAPATPENLVLIPETVETNNQFSTLVAHFELRNNSWITDRCEIILYRGFNAIETKVVPVAPQCAPKSFNSKTYDIDFNVNYDINSAGLYHVDVKCYNDTCC